MIREMQEEIGRKVLEYRFLRSEYFPKTNTLIFNFAVVIDSECLEKCKYMGSGPGCLVYL